MALAKLLKALALFVKELWLRDRTFRQFVRQNLSLIVTSAGFIIMTLLFVHVFRLAKEQEVMLGRYERQQIRLQKELDTKIPLLTERADLYQERYEALRDSLDTKPADPPPKPEPTKAPQRPRPKQPVEKPVTVRPPSPELAERWKRLSE
jgi:hypothetical protein